MEAKFKMYKNFFKRILDFTLSLIAFIILLPVMLIVYILVRVKLGKPVIFKQERPGKNEKIFTLYKFRRKRQFITRLKKINKVWKNIKKYKFRRASRVNKYYKRRYVNSRTKTISQTVFAIL